MKLTVHFENWLALIQQVGDDVENEMRISGRLDWDRDETSEFNRRVDQRLTDLGEPLDVAEYERLFGSRYEKGESYA